MGEVDADDRYSIPARFVDNYPHRASTIVTLLVEHWSDHSERKTEGDGIRQLQNVSKVLSAEEYISAETSSNASVTEHSDLLLLISEAWSVLWC